MKIKRPKKLAARHRETLYLIQKWNKVHRECMWQGMTPADADDATQEAFLRAFRRHRRREPDPSDIKSGIRDQRCDAQSHGLVDGRGRRANCDTVEYEEILHAPATQSVLDELLAAQAADIESPVLAIEKLARFRYRPNLTAAGIGRDRRLRVEAEVREVVAQRRTEEHAKYQEAFNIGMAMLGYS